jgi:hypothetical protein
MEIVPETATGAPASVRDWYRTSKFRAALGMETSTAAALAQITVPCSAGPLGT